MLIKQFAERTGLTPATLRFYERRGLLVPSFRGGTSGYRNYGDKEFEAVQQIQIGRALGFSLAEIRKGVADLQAGRMTKAMELAVMEGKLKDVDAKSAELARIRSYLRRKIVWMKNGEKGKRPEFRKLREPC